MPTTTINDVAEFISAADGETVEAVFRLCQNRHKAIRANAQAVALSSLRVGDRVRLRDVSPAYLQGVTATIVGKRGMKFSVELSHAAGRFIAGVPIKVAANCLEKIG